MGESNNLATVTVELCNKLVGSLKENNELWEALLKMSKPGLLGAIARISLEVVSGKTSPSTIEKSAWPLAKELAVAKITKAASEMNAPTAPPSEHGQRLKVEELLNLNITEYGYQRYSLAGKTSQTSYKSPYTQNQWPEAEQEMAEFISDYVRQDPRREFVRPQEKQFERRVKAEVTLYEQFRKIVDHTICQVIDSSRFTIEPQHGLPGGVCDFALMDNILDKPIVSFEIKIDRGMLNEKINQNRLNQLVSYLLKVNFGILTTLNGTLIVEKHQVIRDGKPYKYVKVSRIFDERDFVRAVSFVCLKAIRQHMVELASSKLSRANLPRTSRQDDEDSASDTEDEEDGQGFTDPPANNTRFNAKQSNVKTNSSYHCAVDILYSKEELTMLLSRFSTLKVTLDYEDEDNTESRPYAEGASGYVFLGYASTRIPLVNKVRCAAKIAEIDKFKPGTVYDLCQEARILNYLNRCEVSCVPKLLYSGFLTSNAFFAVVTEYIDNARHFNLDTLKPRRAALLANAINDLHAVGVHHGDLVSNNVLFQRLTNGQERCVIIDYAFSTLFAHPLTFIVLSPISLIDRHGEFQDEVEWIERQRRKDKRQLKKLHRSFEEWFANSEESTANLSGQSMDTSC